MDDKAEAIVQHHFFTKGSTTSVEKEQPALLNSTIACESRYTGRQNRHLRVRTSSERVGRRVCRVSEWRRLGTLFLVRRPLAAFEDPVGATAASNGCSIHAAADEENGHGEEDT